MRLFRKPASLESQPLLFSRKDLFTLIIPLLLQQILAVTVGTVDSMMVSHAGEAAVSGVSLINTLDTVLIIFFTALVTGGAVVISQALGQNNKAEVLESAKQLLYITTALAILLSSVVIIFRDPLLNLLFKDVEDDVMQCAQGYFFYIALSLPFLAVDSVASACFRAAGNTRLTLIVSIAVNIVNIGGNAAFIYGYEMGATGAAIATAIARLSGAVVLFVLAHQKKCEVHFEKTLRYKPNFRIIKKILRIGVPNGIENSMFQFGRLLTQTLISTMGTNVIAANAVALTISNYQYMTGNACSAAMIPIVGRCIGANDKAQAKYYSKIILFLNYGLIWVVIAATFLFLNPIISIYDLSGTSAMMSKNLIIYHALFAMVIWPVGFMLPSSFRAAGDVKYSLVVSLLTMWVFRVAGAYVCALETVEVFKLFSFPGLNMGIYGVWLAMTVDWAFRSTLFFIHYIRGKWLHMRTKA